MLSVQRGATPSGLVKLPTHSPRGIPTCQCMDAVTRRAWADLRRHHVRQVVSRIVAGLLKHRGGKRGQRHAICGTALGSQSRRCRARKKDWKYALALPLDAPGFDACVLREFLGRLLAGSAEQQLLDALLTLCRDPGWLRARGRQRTDSTLDHGPTTGSLRSATRCTTS